MMLKEIKNINDLAKAASLLKNEPLCMAHEYAIGNHGVVISISKTSIGEPASFGIGFPKTEGCAYTATLRKVRKMCRKLHIAYDIDPGTVVVYLLSRRDVNRVGELLKYISGKAFARTYFNNNRSWIDTDRNNPFWAMFHPESFL